MINYLLLWDYSAVVHITGINTPHWEFVLCLYCSPKCEADLELKAPVWDCWMYHLLWRRLWNIRNKSTAVCMCPVTTNLNILTFLQSINCRVFCELASIHEIRNHEQQTDLIVYRARPNFSRSPEVGGGVTNFRWAREVWSSSID